MTLLGEASVLVTPQGDLNPALLGEKADECVRGLEATALFSTHANSNEAPEAVISVSCTSVQ